MGGRRLLGWIRAYLNDVSLKECQAACINTGFLRCKGVNYNASKRECRLTDNVTGSTSRDNTFVIYKAQCTGVCRDLNKTCVKRNCRSSSYRWYCQKTCGVKYCYVQGW